MKKLFSLLLLLILLTPGYAFADYNYDILSYDVHMLVDDQNVYHITETINVDFKQNRHGLFRYIPTKFYNYIHEIENTSVTDELGVPYPYAISNQGERFEFKIGSPDYTVFGKKTYVIKYDFVMGDDMNKEFDQVYWNLIGQDWASEIPLATFTVELPHAGFDETTLNVTKGGYGSLDKANWQVNGNTVTGSAENLQYYEGLTFRLDMKEGYFTDVPKPYKVGEFLGIFGVLGAGILAAFSLKAKNVRNNEIIPIVSFDPPGGINPAEAKYIESEEILADQDMASIILQWASKGYLRIEEHETSGLFGGRDEMTYHRLVESSALPSNYERKLFAAMFRHGDGSQVTANELKHHFYADIQEASASLKAQFTGSHEILVNNFQYLPMVILAVSFIAAVLFIGKQLGRLMGVNSLVGYIIAGVVLLLLLFITASLQNRKSNSKKAVPAGCLNMILLPVITIAIYLAMNGAFSFKALLTSLRLPKLTDPWVLLVLASFILVGILFYALMGIKKYTDFAREALPKIRGFKDFLEKAKTEEVNQMFQTNPHYYYDVLPYIYVFGLTKIWDKHLKELVIPPPDWYTGDRPFVPGRFYVNFGTNFSTANSRPPAKSSGSQGGGFGGGFGGGGFSGGGGGGGGGGSW